MLATNSAHTKKEEKIRRKKLLRAYREDQQAIIWNKVMDEAGLCDVTALKADWESFDFPASLIDPEFENFDEG